MTTFLVTGAAGGIGCELCRQIQAAGAKAIAVCRKSSVDLVRVGEAFASAKASPLGNRLGVQVEAGIDITADESVADLARRLQGITIDVLINNAGIMERNTLDRLNFDSIRHQFEVNALGALRVTAALLPNLQAGSKIALITSRMGSIDDNTSGGSYGYRMSKVALSMAGKSLAIDLRSRQIPVAIIHPGLVSTAMTGYHGIPAAESVRGILQRISDLNLANSGTFWHANGEILPW
jgi:NAD(P)-dependent dehydrogenase (short-subunit alcohol dehydrogenase family)